MNKKDEIIAIIRGLELEPQTLVQLMVLIDAVEDDVLPDDVVREIKIILLEEEERALDVAASELGIDVVNDPQLKQAEDEYKRGVAEIKSIFDTDMAELDSHLEKLEEAERQLQGADDAVQIDSLTATLKA